MIVRPSCRPLRGPACPLRARSLGIGPAARQFQLPPSYAVQIRGELPVALLSGAQIDHRAPGRGVTDAVHQLRERSCGFRTKRVPGIPQIVDMRALGRPALTRARAHGLEKLLRRSWPPLTPTNTKPSGPDPANVSRLRTSSGTIRRSPERSAGSRTHRPRTHPQPLRRPRSTRDLLQLSGLRPRPELRELAERFGVLP